jgi:hypothetical protein
MRYRETFISDKKHLPACVLNSTYRMHSLHFPAGRGLYLCWELEGEETSAYRSDTSSVHDRGRVKPVCKTSSETGLEKQIVRMLRAELRCNDIEPVVSKWRLGQRGHF